LQTNYIKPGARPSKISFGQNSGQAAAEAAIAGARSAKPSEPEGEYMNGESPLLYHMR